MLTNIVWDSDRYKLIPALLERKAKLIWGEVLYKKHTYLDAYYRMVNFNFLEKTLKKEIQSPIEIREMRESKKIWILWLQGEEHAPDLVRACINSARRCFSQEYEIIVLSEKNLEDYVHLPDYIDEKYRSGNIPFAHYSDLIRLFCLITYGGLWIDSTVLCTGNSDLHQFEKNDLFVYKTFPHIKKEKTQIISSNWLIYSKSNHPILMKTYYLLCSYWRKYNKIHDYYIFHMMFCISARELPLYWERVPSFCNCNPHLMQFELLDDYSEERWNQLLRFSDFHKLNRRISDPDNANCSNYNHIIQTYGIKAEEQ